MNFYTLFFLFLYGPPFFITVSMPGRRELGRAVAVQVLVLSVLIYIGLREMQVPGGHDDLGATILGILLTLVIEGLLAGGLTCLLLTSRRTLSAGAMVRKLILLAGFFCLPVMFFICAE